MSKKGGVGKTTSALLLATELAARGAAVTIIDADPDLLAQVVINLLRNAADAAECHRDRPEVSLSIAAISAGRTRIEVADNGPGLPSGVEVEQLFESFFTTERSGTGI